MRAELLKILRETKDYVSGQQLCEHFHVSRTAIWKIIHQLEEEGYQIEAVKKRGYRIRTSPDVITEKEVKSRLHSNWMGKNCIYLDIVDSTNNYAKKIAEEGAEEGTLILAEEQTNGKGRRGKTWTSARGEQISMTLLLRPSVKPIHTSRMTLLMAMAVVKGINKVTGLEGGIKWPNDIVINKKKVCGILTELNTEFQYIHYVIIGAGINVNQRYFPEDIRNMASSLYLELGTKVSRAKLIAVIVEEFEKYYEIFLKTEDLSSLYKEYNRICVNCGREVRVLDPGKEYVGTASGINENGELIVTKKDGTIVHVYAGEVSVRGIYGYV